MLLVKVHITFWHRGAYEARGVAGEQAKPMSRSPPCSWPSTVVLLSLAQFAPPIQFAFGEG